jgi:hypothetical protein
LLKAHSSPRVELEMMRGATYFPMNLVADVHVVLLVSNAHEFLWESTRL